MRALVINQCEAKSGLQIMEGAKGSSNRYLWFEIVLIDVADILNILELIDTEYFASCK